MTFNWTCPYCDRAQAVTKANQDSQQFRFSVTDGADKDIGLQASAIVCANPECRKATVMVRINQMRYDYNEWIINENGKVYFWEKVKPRGSAKAMPDYIPQAIRNDYEEACLIRDLSPKASATLSRRCLQGMIRNFAKPEAKSDKLFDEIKALEAAIEDGTAPREVSADSVAALTAVRKVGNIGAHMEANVDVIVDVDAGEAQVLIELIESLLQDWYVERHKRQQRFAATTQLAVEKDKQIKDARAGQKALAAPALSGQGAAEEPAA